MDQLLKENLKKEEAEGRKGRKAKQKQQEKRKEKKLLRKPSRKPRKATVKVGLVCHNIQVLMRFAY